MCKAPKPQPVKTEPVQVLRNPFLDAERSGTGTAAALRNGRNSLRIPLATSLGGITPPQSYVPPIPLQ